ncbi:MAG TPA: bifunctional hydroxymethylpyrimidine kinase/phosphomethylpyrimidine kinase [Acidimicrobiales bacterium]|nr:bifunctional hydroxymethylpyrimidine kinase/phosphomethylpyrimidine kinase [Acidimicrobiales bacterium]
MTEHLGSVVPPVALTIAGTDSGGGAGIAADLRTFAAHGVFGTLAVTAVTAQDTMAVHGVVVLDAAFVDAQIEAAIGDFPVLAAKTGMLATLEIVEAVTARAIAGSLPPLVVDPVMISTSGASLLVGDAPASYRQLLPHALITTPNMDEAAALTGRVVTNRAEMADAARALCDLGVRYALVTGGHLAGEVACDVLFDGTDLVELSGEMVPSPNVHGTGCTLSAAITANLALGHPPVEASAKAKRYVSEVIAGSALWRLGGGSGPLDHFSARRAAHSGRTALLGE